MADRENPWAQMFEAAGDDALRALNQREHERANARLHLTPAQAAGLAAGTHVVVPVDVLLAVLDEAAADSIYASCKCLSPDEAAISRHHQERIEQLRGLAAAQKEG
tara:strand:- start:677 stop:994 length:318 start_codon:yes stop_codon:yes gene_type:complete